MSMAAPRLGLPCESVCVGEEEGGWGGLPGIKQQAAAAKELV